MSGLESLVHLWVINVVSDGQQPYLLLCSNNFHYLKKKKSLLVSFNYLSWSMDH